MALAGLSGIALSIDAFKIIPIAASTFDETYVNTNRSMDNTFALVAFIVMDFFSSVASGMPWMLISEIFPIRVRAAAAGLSASVAYLSMFGLTITYIHVEAALSIGGAAMAYSVLTLIGFVFLFGGKFVKKLSRNGFFFCFSCLILYKVLPETEGFSLEEIEQHFAKKDRSHFDRVISRIPQREITACWLWQKVWCLRSCIMSCTFIRVYYSNANKFLNYNIYLF